MVAIAVALCGCNDPEREAAYEAYEAQREKVEQQIEVRNDLIEECQAIIQKGEPALDPSLTGSLETAISNLRTISPEVPVAPLTTEELEAGTADLEAVEGENAATIEAAETAKDQLERSIAQYALVDAPTEAYVIERLQGIDGVGDISAVTEDHDPNGMLNKPGGYTAEVYFSSPWVDQSQVSTLFGDTVIDKGTDGGGAIEVFETPEQAEKRKEYLATYDGTIYANGSHDVVGTVLVRTSNKLTASQQQQLSQAIIASLTALPE